MPFSNFNFFLAGLSQRIEACFVREQVADWFKSSILPQASWVVSSARLERVPDKDEVAGLNPAPPTSLAEVGYASKRYRVKQPQSFLARKVQAYRVDIN